MSDYYEDEYDDYYDACYEPESWSVWKTLMKRQNGRLVVRQTTHALYPGQWSHEGDWDTEYYNLNDCEGWFIERAIQWARTAKPGDEINTVDWYYDDEDDEDVPYSPDCPYCLRQQFHTLEDHEAALERSQ